MEEFYGLGFVALIFISVVSGGLSSTLASKKGYSSGAWFACGFFFGILGLIAAAGLPLNPNEICTQEQLDLFTKIARIGNKKQ